MVQQQYPHPEVRGKKCANTTPHTTKPAAHTPRFASQAVNTASKTSLQSTSSELLLYSVHMGHHAPPQPVVTDVCHNPKQTGSVCITHSSCCARAPPTHHAYAKLSNAESAQSIHLRPTHLPNRRTQSPYRLSFATTTQHAQNHSSNCQLNLPERNNTGKC